MQKKYNTKTGQAIENYISSQNETCFCAADVMKNLEEQNVQMNLTTVYRNLDKLVAQDKLMKYKASDSDTFLYRIARDNGSCHNHLHLQCRICGKVIHMDPEIMEIMKKQLSSQYGFTLECEHSSICGVCKDCSEKKMMKI